MTWRRAGSEDIPLALLWAAAAAAAGLAASWLPWLSRLAPPCAFHALTGIPCLACGSTRAALALAHGDLAVAVGINPLAALALLAGTAGGLLAPVWVLWRGPLPRLAAVHRPRWRVAGAMVLALDWIYLVARGV